MDDKIIVEKMHELAKKIDYEITDLLWLKKAMYCKPLDDKKQEYADESLATLGDTVLKLILTESLYNKGSNKAEITNKKQKMEDNNTLFKLCNKYGIYKYAYNDTYIFTEAPLEKQLPHPQHDFYIEAVIGAIYKDKGLEYCRNWVINFFNKNNCLPD
ncbi:MAG: hypothetical protein J1G07_01840 [Clostridiales bacterium]|nr:hypothetical protein [Clostridiales bacterium]